VPAAREAGSSRKTVIIALAANALIAVAKLIGGVISGSTALLAEAAHSVADTTNQGFLLGSISLSGREPSPEHPFGHGTQRFLWTFVAAVGMFVAGAVFAVGYGVMELLSGSKEEGGFGAAWITLAIAVVAEGASWLRALRQTRREAAEAEKPLKRYVSESRDPSVKMVLFEDSAALAGIAIAAVGIGLHQVTGQAYWDPIASILIGVLLIVVAARMARDTGHLLVGAAALPEEREAIERVLENSQDVDEVIELLTLVLGPSALLVAARIDLADGVGSDRLEQAMSELDDAIRDAVPDVTEVFLDPTPARER
jgi:cation diffusion facilitator family transporter